MEPAQRPTFALAGAGGVLFGTTAAFVLVGALIGWAAGSVEAGIVIGVILGIPAGILAVYRKYREAI